MTYNYNDNNLIIGYIKEFLANFNLPKCKVYIPGKTELKENKLYINKETHKLIRCIKDGNTLKTKELQNYILGSKLINLSTNLEITSATYDNYTHKYLGDCLRFLRDYTGLNLMPLYNCFLPEQPYKLNFTASKLVVNTSDNKYNYYLVPVKFGEQYTIGIDILEPFEVACMLYTGEKVSNLSKDLITATYKKYPSGSYSKPLVYSINIDYTNYSKQESNLRLLLKIPKTAKSSISILEGNYTSCISHNGRLVPKLIYSSTNLGILNNVVIPTKLSLLSYNTGTSHPFADRLVEYLLGNVITNLDTIPNNISGVQEKLYKDKMWKGISGIWDNNIKAGIYDLATIKYKYPTATLLEYNFKETSEDEWVEIKDKLSYVDLKEDLLMFVDKDIESVLGIL